MLFNFELFITIANKVSYNMMICRVLEADAFRYSFRCSNWQLRLLILKIKKKLIKDSEMLHKPTLKILSEK